MNKIAKLIIHRISGFLVFLIILFLVNKFINSTDNFDLVANFMTSNLILIITFAILFLIGEISFELKYPYTLIGPLANSIGAMYLINFILKLLTALMPITKTDITSELSNLIKFIYPVVFVVILIFGYYPIYKKRLNENNTKLNNKSNKSKKSTKNGKRNEN